MKKILPAILVSLLTRTYVGCVLANTALNPAAPTVRLKKDQLLAAARGRKWHTARDLARGLGLNPAQISRAFNENHPQGPGQRFIASVLHAFPERRFEDFFEVDPPLRVSAQRAS
jgi:hypothetical protein